jgi:hypothetical protein
MLISQLLNVYHNWNKNMFFKSLTEIRFVQVERTIGRLDNSTDAAMGA